ncbi:hypothetical protein GF327_01475 [Candidatus Woesearchaeota archaeon]|nr:hypothetical protein [Candidatus Woesearchaeota archaeon]
MEKTKNKKQDNKIPEPPKFRLNDIPKPPDIEKKEDKKNIFSKIFHKGKNIKEEKKKNSFKKQDSLFNKKKNKEITLDDLPEPPKIKSLQTPLEKKSNHVHNKPLINIPTPDNIPKFDYSKIDNSNKKKHLKTPGIPKFNNLSKKKASLTNEFHKEDIPSPPHLDKTKKKDKKIPFPNKKGFFSKIVNKFKKQEKPKKSEIRSKPQPIHEVKPIENKPIKLDLPPPPPPKSIQIEKPKKSLPPETPSIPEITQDFKPEPISSIFDQKSEDKATPKIKKDKSPIKKEKPVSEKKIEKELNEKIKIKEKPKTPLIKVKGIGKKREKEFIKKFDIKYAEELIEKDLKHITKKTKLSKKQAKKIIKSAKQILKKKKKVTQKKNKKNKDITALISELEEEKKELDKLREEGIKGLPEIKGHEDILNLLEKLEKKKLELMDYENNLKEKEKRLSSVKKTYKRDADYLDNLKRTLDHDIRERTQYLIDLEKEFFQKGQEIAKRESKLETRKEELDSREEELSLNEKRIKTKIHELEDKQITLDAREKKLNKLRKELEEQEELLEEKEKELENSEKEYVQRLKTLKTHEEKTNTELNKRKRDLDKKEKELKKLKRRIDKKERTIDIEDRALDYAESKLEDERQKLEDDEFKQYLHEKLGMIKESGVNINDMNKAQNIRVPDLQETPQTIYNLIEKCRHLVKQERTKEAKLFYNRIRERFYNTKNISPDEKESLHNVIRSLYDEIHLADLEIKY